jgi:succinyl-diaminopimelate desuccinylase
VLRDELAGLVCSFIRIPSVTGTEKALSDRIFEELRAAGLSPEQDADGNVVCVVGEGERTAVVNGHLDTVPPAPGWEGDPFAPVVRGERIYGLGSTDMKGGLAVMVALAKAVQPKVRAAFAFTVNEEGGATSPRNGARTFTDSHDFDYAITCEPTYDEATGRLNLGIGCQGRSIARVTVRGKATHSAAYDQGINAIYRAVPVIERVKAMADAVQPVQVAPGIAVKPALSVTVLRAGEATNVIPAECLLTIDRRLAPGEDFETFARELAEFTAGVDASAEQQRGSLPVLANLQGPLVTLAEGILRRRFGQVDYYFNRGRVDLSYFGRKTPEVLNLGPGVISRPHQANEYASIPALLAGYEVLKELLESLR